MAFEDIIGQSRVKRTLQLALQHDRVSHAYLFLGERGVGKEAMALDFARKLLCSSASQCADEACIDCSRVRKLNHPDLHLIFPAPAKPKEEDIGRILSSLVDDPYCRLEIWANPMISIERIREIRKISGYKSFEGKGRVIVIFDCERMTNEAANSLLKILEEPPEKTYLLMISSRPNLLLSTITSRCQQVKFESLSFTEIEEAMITRHGVDPQKARLTARLSGGNYKKALQLLEDDIEDMQTQALNFLRKSVQSQYVQINFVEELINSFHRDGKRVRELLMLVVNWFRDAMLVKEARDSADRMLINLAQREVLDRFTQNLPDADLHSAILEIERALELMDRNVQLNLILIVLLNNLRKHLRRT